MLADILHLVEVEMYNTALAFGIGIRLTLYCRAAALAWYDFVLRHGHRFKKQKYGKMNYRTLSL